MTVFYAIPPEVFASEGIRFGDYKIGNTTYSVLEPKYLPDPEELPEGYVPVVSVYLVNTTSPISAWEAYETFPETPTRIFG